VVVQDGNVCALRASDGSLLWCFKDGQGGASSLAVIRGVIFLTEAAGGLAALRASDGLVLWSYTPQVPTAQWSPLVVEGPSLITLQDGSMEALHASTGALLWHHTLKR
jgi:outer membrane protein assembly factor BamB